MYLQILYTQEIDLWATSEAKHINEWIWSKKKNVDHNISLCTHDPVNDIPSLGLPFFDMIRTLRTLSVYYILPSFLYCEHG